MKRQFREPIDQIHVRRSLDFGREAIVDTHNSHVRMLANHLTEDVLRLEVGKNEATAMSFTI
jgi:hypothetical protein